jgi:hypothetical protein
MATVAYFHTNPILVIISWLIALGGEVFEKWGIGRSRFQVRTFKSGGQSPFSYQDQPMKPQSTIDHGDIIEAEFTKKP